jgi:hypothetical protein
MTQEEFIEVLDEKGYYYEIEGNKLVITYSFSVHLSDLTSLPPDVVFNNGGNVWVEALTSLPPGVEFKNEGDVKFRSLTSLPPGVEFKNVGNVYLRSLIGGGSHYWKGNIEGIEPTSLLNVMIKRGMFI